MRPGARARRGRADRRDGRVAQRLRPAGGTARRPASAARWCSSACSSRTTSPPRSSRRRSTSLPTRSDIRPPVEDTALPVLHLLGQAAGRRQARRRPGGRPQGVRGRPDRADDARRPAPGGRRAGRRAWLPYEDGPRASLVAIENRTSEVLAMVGGDDYPTRPFNLATQGQRQPGSSFKPFVLAQALGQGISPDSTWKSRRSTSASPTRRAGAPRPSTSTTTRTPTAACARCARATTYSDNSVYAQVGIKVGTRKIARLARRMGIRTPVRTTRDDARRPQAGRHAARHGARVRDVRPRGRFTYGTMSPGAVDRRKLGIPTPARSASARSASSTTARSSRSSSERREGRERARRLARAQASVADQVASILRRS